MATEEQGLAIEQRLTVIHGDNGRWRATKGGKSFEADSPEQLREGLLLPGCIRLSIRQYMDFVAAFPVWSAIDRCSTWVQGQHGAIHLGTNEEAGK